MRMRLPGHTRKFMTVVAVADKHGHRGCRPEWQAIMEKHCGDTFQSDSLASGVTCDQTSTQATRAVS